MKFVATFEVDFTDEEVNRFNDLAKQLGKSFPDTVRMCANEKAEELLMQFKLNVPQPPDVNGNNIQPIREGTNSEA